MYKRQVGTLSFNVLIPSFKALAPVANDDIPSSNCVYLSFNSPAPLFNVLTPLNNVGTLPLKVLIPLFKVLAPLANDDTPSSNLS